MDEDSFIHPIIRKFIHTSIHTSIHPHHILVGLDGRRDVDEDVFEDVDEDLEGVTRSPQENVAKKDRHRRVRSS